MDVLPQPQLEIGGHNVMIASLTFHNTNFIFVGGVVHDKESKPTILDGLLFEGAIIGHVWCYSSNPLTRWAKCRAKVNQHLPMHP